MKPSQPAMVLLPLGTLLQNGTYRLEQLLSHHHWELTYLGTHVPSQQPVLIKTLNPSHKKADKITHQRDYFCKQAYAWQQVQHPTIARVRDIFVESILPFMVTEKYPGQTWADLVQNHPLSEADAIAQIRRIGRGLTLAHQHDLHHGDIRPDNLVMHSRTEHPILNNMSLVLPSANSSSPQDNHTYAAPERCLGKRTSETDIYELAATFYTLLTGQLPVSANQRRYVRFEPHQHSELSQATVIAILRGMAMQPQNRPQSVSEWIKLLPQEHSQPVASGAESVKISSASSTLPKQPSPLGPPVSGVKDIKVLPLPSLELESPAPLQEHSQTVSSNHPQPYMILPNFPIRILMICAFLSGAVGIVFGLVLRFHYQNQFTNPQVPAKDQPVQNEPFLPKSQPTDRPVETSPRSTDSSETPVESPIPSNSDEPAIESRDQEGIEPNPTLTDPALLTPDALETDRNRPDAQTLPPDSANLDSPNLEDPTAPGIYTDPLVPELDSPPESNLLAPNPGLPPLETLPDVPTPPPSEPLPDFADPQPNY